MKLDELETLVQTWIEARDDPNHSEAKRELLARHILVSISPEVVLTLIACVRAYDAVGGYVSTAPAHLLKAAYDARAKLESQ